MQYLTNNDKLRYIFLRKVLSWKSVVIQLINKFIVAQLEDSTESSQKFTISPYHESVQFKISVKVKFSSLPYNMCP
jgi:hypothetical protein